MQLKSIPVINPLLKDYIDYYYYLTTSDNEQISNYFAYPSTNIQLCFLAQCAVNIGPDFTTVKQDLNEGLKCVIVGYRANPVKVKMQSGIREFCISFKPLGINLLKKQKIGNLLKCGLIETTEFDFLKESVIQVLADENEIIQLENIILESLIKTKEILIVRGIVDLISANEAITFAEISTILAIPYKNIYRLFIKHLGVTPAQFRKIIKFKLALTKGADPAYQSKMSTIALESGYFDQAHYINEFKKITHLTPKNFIASVWFDKSKKIAWKFE